MYAGRNAIWTYPSKPSRYWCIVSTLDELPLGRTPIVTKLVLRDLEIRGPGEFLGARQSGAPLLRFADLQIDAGLLAWAREVAPLMLDQHAELAERHVLRWLGGAAEYLKA